MKKNVILVDWIPKEGWSFKDLLDEHTCLEWTVKGTSANGSQRGRLKKLINVYLKYFTFPIGIFLKRKEYENLLAWQQFFGIIFAFYCKVFKVKNFPRLFIMTFIYKPKKGILGKVYYNFIKSILSSKYIEKIICFSKSEMGHYSNIFNIDIKKFDYTIYAINSEVHSLAFEDNGKENQGKEYFLSVGRSNRDYEFLINSLRDEKYNLVVLCDKLSNEKKHNIEIYNNVFGESYFSYLKNCIAVIIPLKDENISSGQLVLLEAMQYGKPVIITKSNTINHYIINDHNGLIINKDKESLILAMEKISNDGKYYNEISNNACRQYKEKFSFNSFAKSIGKIITNCH